MGTELIFVENLAGELKERVGELRLASGVLTWHACSVLAEEAIGICHGSVGNLQQNYIAGIGDDRPQDTLFAR